MESETVRWQETLQHSGTAQERDAAFVAFKSNPDGQHFVFGYSHSDESAAAKAIEERQKKNKKAVKDNHPSVPDGFSSADNRNLGLGNAGVEPEDVGARVSSLNERMKQSRERRAQAMGGRHDALGSKVITSASKRPNKPAPTTEIEQSQDALAAFMGHQR